MQLPLAGCLGLFWFDCGVLLACPCRTSSTRRCSRCQGSWKTGGWHTLLEKTSSGLVPNRPVGAQQQKERERQGWVLPVCQRCTAGTLQAPRGRRNLPVTQSPQPVLLDNNFSPILLLQEFMGPHANESSYCGAYGSCMMFFFSPPTYADEVYTLLLPIDQLGQYCWVGGLALVIVATLIS